jgi:hypothetical protein
MVSMSEFRAGDVLCFATCRCVEPSLWGGWLGGTASKIDKGFLNGIFWSFAPTSGVQHQGIAEVGK